MWFLPFDILKLKSDLNIDQIFDTLQEVIDPNGYAVIRLTPPPNHIPYRGSLSLNGFSIMRWIHYKNPFLPIIIRKIISQASNNTIFIKMFLNPFGLLIGIFLISLPFGWLDKQSLQTIASVLIYIFLLFVYKAEAVYSMDFFRKIFEKISLKI